jgi:ABC-type glucose/galactose transport system permease subunit
VLQALTADLTSDLAAAAAVDTSAVNVTTITQGVANVVITFPAMTTLQVRCSACFLSDLRRRATAGG